MGLAQSSIKKYAPTNNFLHFPFSNRLYRYAVAFLEPEELALSRPGLIWNLCECHPMAGIKERT